MPEPVQDPSRGNVSTRNAGEGDCKRLTRGGGLCGPTNASEGRGCEAEGVEADPLKVSQPEAGVGCKKEAAQ